MDDLVTWLRGVLDEEHRRYQDQILDWQEPEGWDGGDHVDDLHYLRWHSADIEAKRAILNLHFVTVRTRTPFDPYTGERRGPAHDVDCGACGWASSDPTSACETVRLLASAYKDRPGYRNEWRP